MTPDPAQRLALIAEDIALHAVDPRGIDCDWFLDRIGDLREAVEDEADRQRREAEGDQGVDPPPRFAKTPSGNYCDHYAYDYDRCLRCGAQRI